MPDLNFFKFYFAAKLLRRLREQGSGRGFQAHMREWQNCSATQRVGVGWERGGIGGGLWPELSHPLLKGYRVSPGMSRC